MYSDAVLVAVIGFPIMFFIGVRVGYLAAKSCINEVAAELYKQLDLDNKPFVNDDDDFDDDDDATWETDPDFWKRGKRRPRD